MPLNHTTLALCGYLKIASGHMKYIFNEMHREMEVLKDIKPRW